MAAERAPNLQGPVTIAEFEAMEEEDAYRIELVRGQDVAFLSVGRIPADAPRRGFWRVGPDLAVEVLSPSNRRSPVRDRLKQYFAAGVQLVWLVDPIAETVTVRDATGVLARFAASEVLTGAPVLPDLRIEVAALFRLP